MASAKPTPIKQSAEAFLSRYAAHIASGRALSETDDPAERDQRLAAWASRMIDDFFLPGCVSVGMGPAPVAAPSQEAAKQGMRAHVGRYLELGLGFEAELVKGEVVTFFDHGDGSGSAVVDVIWRGKPRNVKGWDMHAVYGYRKLEDGKEGWELGYFDGEIQGLKEHFPKFFDGYPPTPPS